MKYCLLLTAAAALSTAHAQTSLHLHTGAPADKPAVLSGKDATLQLIATAASPDKPERDATRSATWTVTPANVLAVSPAGVATPLNDGAATITATADGVSATATVTVTVTAANDAPTNDAPLSNQTNVDADGVSLPVAGNFSDLDGDSLSFSATGLPPRAFDQCSGRHQRHD